MAATLFQKQTPASRIFYAQSSSVPPLPGFGPAFNFNQAWVPGGSATVDQNAQTTALPDAWAAGGVFLFLGASLANESAFLARFAILTSHPQYRTARLMWIANPNAREDQWIIWNIRISPKAGGTSSVGALARFDFLNYAFLIGTGCSVTAQESSFVIVPAAADSIFLTVQYGEARLPVVPKGPVTISYVDNPGCLAFPVEAGPTFFDDVEAGCRLFFPNQGAIGSIRHPVFAPAQEISLNATIDPFAPQDATRTAFAFQTGQVLSSHFRTNAGQPVSLTAMAGSRLLFAPLPLLRAPAATTSYYLVPDGPFGIQGPGTPPRLLCGIFGAEFIELTGDSIITFVAGKPAFVPAYDPATGLPPGDGQVQSAFTSEATTSWAAVYSPTNTLCYSAVPDGSPFFRTAPKSQDLTLLEYYGACSAFLPQSATSTYPLLPYAGVVAEDFTATFTLEQRLLAPFRRQTIQANQAATPVPPPTGDTDSVVTLTPQGMVAQFTADRTIWESLTVGGSEAGPFRLTTVVDPLRSALLTNQQFVVISDPAALVPLLGTNNVIQVEGWTVTIDQAGWNRYGTIAIVKNSPRSLQELVADLHSWTLATKFNASPARTQQRLLDILNQAASEASSVEFEYFANTVAADPGWNGVLLLNCPLQFPASFEGLAGAVNPDLLFAHHMGFNQTPVARTVKAEDSQISSLFGLIDYSDNSPASGFSDFEFKVTTLHVVFKNSAVSSLAASADLYVRALFGSSVAGNSRAPLKLKGTFETHGTAKVFAMISAEGPRILSLNDSVLAGVRIQNTHFATQSGGDGTGPTTSRFDFWGGLQFAIFQGSDGAFDLFSYADLTFSKMGANMITSSDGRSQTFQFDPFAMTFDASASPPRAGSLAAQFPVQLKGFTFSADKTTPTGAGYLDIALSQLSVSPIVSPWYGLVFNLNLGTLGTLAADAGLVATFAAIWSPGGGPPRAFAGIHLPGLSGGQNQVSLMGVVKLAMHSVELVRQGGNFVLLLDGIALKLFGKSLPPGGSFDFYLFGDPKGIPGANQLAWYGAYLKNQ